ncbi:MAG: imidazoleglycerol-phosphate dehydratase HisB [Acidaminococcales bacterium]|jgi:imidazoleglycerol-phosphate dehydratase|nr:imidazoleglycerol-phosphate dehydratase HisB [Acidaminococcales bacterium]
MRQASLKRDTAETSVSVEWLLDGRGFAAIDTGIGFFDHMLTLLGKHGLFDLTVKARGDLAVDAHHTVEDCGIALGSALKEALGDKAGINRYGSAFVPMDEALAHAAVDLSGRAYLVFNAKFPPSAGGFDFALVEEFFRALSSKAEMTLHVNLLYGANAHHMAEAVFKAFARALCRAAAFNERIDGILSTKGILA